MPWLTPEREERETRTGVFNPNHAQYTSCCQRVHTNVASMVIAWFHIVISSGFLAFIFRSLLTGHKPRLEGGFEMFISLVCLSASSLLVVGLRIENRKFILVYLYCQVLATAIFFVLFLALIMGLKAGVLDDPNHDGYNTLEEELLIMVEIFVVMSVVILEVWFISIVLKSYRFFNDKYNYTGVDREAVV